MPRTMNMEPSFTMGPNAHCRFDRVLHPLQDCWCLYNHDIVTCAIMESINEQLESESKGSRLHRPEHLSSCLSWVAESQIFPSA